MPRSSTFSEEGRGERTSSKHPLVIDLKDKACSRLIDERFLDEKSSTKSDLAGGRVDDFAVLGSLRECELFAHLTALTVECGSPSLVVRH
jgi:hypothetical protein